MYEIVVCFRTHPLLAFRAVSVIGGMYHRCYPPSSLVDEKGTRVTLFGRFNACISTVRGHSERLRVQEHTYARVATSHYMGAITMCRLLILSFP
jgi:hypothetical protein